MSNLTKRILTAVVLLALFIAALVVNTPLPFFLLTLLMIGAGAWEWSRLNGWAGWRAWASGVVCVACAAGLHILIYDPAFNDFPGSIWPLVVNFIGMTFCVVFLFWIIGGPWLLWLGVARWPALPRWLRWCIGMAALVVAWFALAAAYLQGVNFLLSILALVWAADIGAYAFGRALGGKLTGGRKLAPTISPGKTWEGAVGGFICVLLVGAVWIWFDSLPSPNRYPVEWQVPHCSPLVPSLYTVLWHFSPILFLFGLAFLTAMSIVGDLFESLVKRAAGVKDSSQLLPGHGGVLDRIDALLPTLPLAVLVNLLLATIC